MKKTIWSVLLLFLFLLPRVAQAQEVQYHSNSTISFFGTYITPEEDGQDGERISSEIPQEEEPNHSELPKTGENVNLSLQLGLLSLGSAWVLRKKFMPHLKENL